MRLANDEGADMRTDVVVAAQRPRAVPVPEGVAEYKRILKAALDVRPSGFRRKLAAAIGRNPSFVTQITNPSYPVPIPVTHVDTIVEVCRLSDEERGAFLAAYAKAHPRRTRPLVTTPKSRTRSLVIDVPDFGSARANARFDAALAEFVRHLSAVVGDPV
jgi:hypothetical protein